MTIITFINRKGGCGKTSLTCLFALYWAQEGLKVAVRDLDPQESSATFVKRQKHPNISLWKGKEDKPDILLVDTLGGMQDTDIREFVEKSNLVLIPFTLSPTDIRATGQTSRVINNQDKARLIFNKVNTSTNAFKDRDNYADAMGIDTLKNYLCDRVAYKYALVEGWGALDKKAKDELTALIKEVEEEVR